MHLRFAFLLSLHFIFKSTIATKIECGLFNLGSSKTFPWNVGIYVQHENQLELVCFLTIIQANAILTAAHCFCDNVDGRLRNVSFYLLTENLSNTINLKEHPNVQHINKNGLHIHKHYKGLSRVLANDVAIIKGNFQFGNKAVCIDWSQDIKDKKLNTKQPLWNKNKQRIIDQTYLEAEECALEAPDSFHPFITSDKSCVKTTDTSLNHESEGAGLVYQYNTHWYIKGVISMHDVTQNKLSTYTPVSQYMTWISNIGASI